MKTILLPTDFSETAQNAAEYAISTFGTEEVQYILLNAYQVPHAGASMLVSITDILRQESENELQGEVERLQNRFTDAIAIQAKSLHGDVFTTLEQVQNSQEIDFVVMGTKGASGLKEVLVGSNAASVIRKSTRPVLVVPGNAEHMPLQKVVVATDFHQIDDAAVLEPLLKLCELHKSKVGLLNVRKDAVESGVSESLQGLVLNHVFENIDHSFHFVDNNDVVSGIKEYLEKEQPNMVVMLPRHTSFLDRIFHRSVTNRLAMHTDIPLLTLPELNQ